MKQTELQVTLMPFFGPYVMNMYEEMRKNGKKDREDAFMREQFEIIDDYIEQA